MNTVVSLDTESYYNTKLGYGLKELGTWRYCRDDRFDVYMLSVSDGSQTWAGHPKDFRWESLEGSTLLSHNAAHDRTVVAEMQRRNLAPKFEYAQWNCTANLASFLCNRRALDQASEFLLGERVSKAARANADGKYWRDIVAEGKGPEMLEYARGDALRCHQIYSKFGHFWPDFERRLSDLTIRQATRGVQIDVPKLEEYYKVVHAALAAMKDSLPWVKRGEKVLSTKAVAEECRACKIPSPPIKSHEDGEAEFAEWYKTYSGRSDLKWIRTFSDVRSIGILLNTLEKIRTRIDENGILTFGLLYFGSHTGRFSGSGGINFLNFRKAPYFFGDDGFPTSEDDQCAEIEASYVATGAYPAWVRYAVDIRTLIIPRAGRKMIVSDLSQIEPRCEAWLCGDHELLQRVATGKSIYQSHAELTMGWKGEDLEKEDKKLYALAKARVIGLGYQCGAEKFVGMAMTLAGLDITVSDPEFTQDEDKFSGSPIFNEDGTPKMISGKGANSRKIVKEFRASNPKIAGPNGIWATLQNSFRRSIGGDFTVQLPSGRSMVYRDVREEWSREYDDVLKKYKNKRVVKAEVVKSGRIQRVAQYGGLLTENVTQAVARDVMCEHLLALDATSGLDTLFSVHDEIIVEADQGVTAEDIKQAMSVTPEWLPGCPVSAKAKEVPYYLK